MGGGEILKKGWLIKSPPLEGSGLKNWRKRLFCLRSSKVMEYYKSEDGDLKGVINLEDCRAVNSDLFHKKYKYVFDIETRDRTFFLVASSQEEMREWVDAVCKVCGFILQSEPDGPPPSRNSMTLPQQGVAFTEKFKSVENGDGSESFYSLAKAVEHDVYKQLGRDHQVPAGTPLSEALYSKGMGKRCHSSSLSSSTSESVSSTSGGDVTSLSGQSEVSYFTPRQRDNSGFLNTIDGRSLPNTTYATPPRGHPMPKPRAATLMPTPTSGIYNYPTHNGIPPQLVQSFSSTSSAETTERESCNNPLLLENGYMRPRPTPDRVPDYDYPPFGLPRPAKFDQGNISPRQHHSALLRSDSERELPPTPPNSFADPGNTPFGENPSRYINMDDLLEALPPPIDRTKKPASQQPPRVDRSSKPSNTSEASRVQSESPPDFPARVDSLSSRVAEEATFANSDIPKRTKRSTHYTQVRFDPATRRPIPIPRPRPGGGVKRVNYTDVNLKATRELAEKREMLQRQTTLSSAEAEALADKYYINVARDGSIDDDTNPDYYTHMRNFTFEEADKPAYYTFQQHQRGIYDDHDEDEMQIYEAPWEA